jgi:arylsulfatase A-like enzyme
MNFNKGIVFGIASLVTVTAGAKIKNEVKQEKDNPQKPNILYIMSDDHSYNAISAYGSAVSRLAPTPNIDWIANHGMIFERAFVENSLSTPSRACTMTGLYSNQNGQKQLWEGIDSTKVFFTQLLQNAGYQTAIVGKWHMRCAPKGFTYYHILDGQGEYYNPEFKGTDTNGKFEKETGYVTDLVIEHAIEFLNSRNRNKPFCLMVHFKAPHRNQMPNLRYLGMYDNVTFPLPSTFYDDYKTRCSAAHTQKMSISKNMELMQDLKIEQLKDSLTSPYDKYSYNCLMSGLDRMTPAQRAVWENYYTPRSEKFLSEHLKGDTLYRWKYENFLRDYLSCVKGIDNGVGELLDYLKKHGLLKNTLIVYTSDQGFYIGEHNWFDKRFMYEESFRTPLIMSYPGHIKPGTKCYSLVQNIDYAPTFLKLAGLNKTKEMPGLPLEPLFKGKEPADWRKSVYYHYYDYPTYHMVRKHDGVRTSRYKLIHFYGKGGMRGATTKYQITPGTLEYKMLHLLDGIGYISHNDPDINAYELYDLKKDPHELNNVYGKPGYDKITGKLMSLLKDYRRKLNITEY